jgi:hypothetical protein
MARYWVRVDKPAAWYRQRRASSSWPIWSACKPKAECAPLQTRRELDCATALSSIAHPTLDAEDRDNSRLRLTAAAARCNTTAAGS